MNTAELTPTFKPQIASEVSPDWIGAMRAMAENQSIMFRGVALHIEGLDVNNRGEWCKLHTPTGGFDYASAADRDQILVALGWNPSPA